MSEKSLTADLHRAAHKARGKQGDLPQRGRKQALARFARFQWTMGFEIHTVAQIKEKHFRAWTTDLALRGRTKRTIANNVAHLRTALEGAGRRAFADKLSNAELGIAGSSRAGTKVPMSSDALERNLAAVKTIDPGVAIVLELQNEFGLRAAEGVCCVKSLADWLRALENPLGDGFVTVVHGTKGGKTRRCPPLDRERAISIIRRAIALAAQGNCRLVRKMTLRQAMNRYHYVARKAGMTGENAPHGVRYAYATEHLQRARKAGISDREAAAGVSTLLGHGDGRGTWVERVYGREALAKAVVHDA